ncbi:hypothetical protein V474_18930 [Novosphingobium barchaimii LL02]|uniref:Acyltransferase 3 domain-containing protein n=1 Tax=Novosphingobium barchaimii LL02 TaxID=1114963 RepID=A0A0J7XV55_9SPHN|nr:acyltransferase [Novosphingobium barchaimii]KMS55497.1 hypothetical protein V474_18930 [Novosphingobium barchaimii LL02]
MSNTIGLNSIGRSTSKVIAVSRVLCILCVIYAHTPPYGDAVPRTLFGGEAVIWILRETLGRSSVPLLSIISGYLAARVAAPNGFGRTLRKKVLTLLVPLVLWNAIAILIDIVFSLGAKMPAADALPRLLTGIDGFPRLMPLYFLRDIFLCSLSAPLLLMGLRRMRWLLLSSLLANAVWNLDGPLFLASAIPLFYTIGLGAGQKCWQARAILRRPGLSWSLAAGVLVILAMLPFVMTDYSALRADGPANAALLIVQRGAGAVTFCLTAVAIAGKEQLASAFARFEPVIFFVFCSHPLIIGLVWIVLGPASVSLGANAALAAFLIAPPLVLAIAVLAAGILRQMVPRLLRLLMAGKRITDAQMAAITPPLAPLRRKAPEIS